MRKFGNIALFSGFSIIFLMIGTVVHPTLYDAAMILVCLTFVVLLIAMIIGIVGGVWQIVWWLRIPFRVVIKTLMGKYSIELEINR